MKAVVLLAPNEYVYQDVEKPQCPEEGILLNVKYCGLCGSDLRTLRSGHKNIQFPAVLGHEISGIVAEIGPSYNGDFKPGEALCVGPNVYCGTCEFCVRGELEFCENLRELAQHWPGGFAEYIAIPREALDNGVIRRIPDGVRMEHVAVGEPPSSCINAQEKLNVHDGDSLLIIGAGPIGAIHVSVARARGAATIYVADIAASRLEMVKDFGVDAVIDSSKTDLIEEIMKLTGGKGVDVVITANPVAVTQVQAIEVARKAGRIAFFGGLPHADCNVTLDTNKIHYRGLHVIGTTGFAPRHYDESIRYIAKGLIPAEKLVTHVLPLKDFAEGVELARAGQAMKVVFEI